MEAGADAQVVGRPTLLGRDIAVVLVLEALYIAGLAVLFARWSASFGAFDGQPDQGRTSGLLTTIAGSAFVVLLILTAVSLWAGWLAQGHRRSATAWVLMALTLLAHGGAAGLAVAGDSWPAALAAATVEVALAAAWRSPGYRRTLA